MATATTVTSIKLDAGIKKRVQRLASAQRRTPHWIVREAVEQYVDREEKLAKLREDALAAWENFQATGLHVTGEEMDAWLRKVIAGKKAKMPECHV